MKPPPTMPARGKITLGVTLSLAAVIFVVSFGASLLGLVVLFLLRGQGETTSPEIASTPVIQTELPESDAATDTPETNEDDPSSKVTTEQDSTDSNNSNKGTTTASVPSELTANLLGISRFEETWTFAIQFSVDADDSLEEVRVAAVMKDENGELLGTQVLTPIEAITDTEPYDDYLILPASSAEQVKEIAFRVTSFKKAGGGFESTASGVRIPPITAEQIAESLRRAAEALPQEQAPEFLGNRPAEEPPSSDTSLLNSQESGAAMMSLFQVPETDAEKADLDQIVTRSIAELLTESLPEVVSMRQKLPAGQVLSRSPRLEIPKITSQEGQRFLHVLWGGSNLNESYSGVFLVFAQSQTEPDAPWKLLLFLRSFDNQDPSYNHEFESLEDLTRWFEGLSLVQLQELTNALQP